MLYNIGYKVYSQHEEDGILSYLFAKIGTTNKTCVELCAGNGMESNTANLLINFHWNGLLIDGNKTNTKKAELFYRLHENTCIYPPKIINTWVTKDNINTIIKSNKIEGVIDLLSLDIDGNDYHIMKAINTITARVIVLEFNHLLGPKASLTIPYNEKFVAEFSADGADYSGASLAAFIKLLNKKNYAFIGTNRFATNAFFVLKSELNHEVCEEKDIEKYFTHPRAIYGMTERFAKIKDKPWESV
ncbi:hypothetical protein ACUR5C_06315 [Aliikangiella sp. IMCC44653]